MRRITLLLVLLIASTTLLMSGCDEDERLARMAQQSTERQAEQNREMAKLNQQVSENAKQLVERDAQCRSDLNKLQHQVHQAATAERQNLDRQRESLESERRDIATKRHRDPIIASAIMQVGLVLACLLPLVFCVYLLRAQRNEEVSEQVVAELLMHELVAEQSPLLGSRNVERAAIGVERTPKLSAASEDEPH